MILTPDTPCQVTIVPDDGGGVIVVVKVPTYSGWSEFTIATERDGDGDWRVHIPWPGGGTDPDGIGILPDGHEVANGVVYIGAPDVAYTD